MFSITVLKESIYEAVTYIKPIVTKDVRNSKNDCIMMTVKQGSVELFMYNAHEAVDRLFRLMCSVIFWILYQTATILILKKTYRAALIFSTEPESLW